MAAAEAGAGEVIHARHAGSVRARSACFINTLSGYCSATSDCGVIGDRLFRMGMLLETCCRGCVDRASPSEGAAATVQPHATFRGEATDVCGRSFACLLVAAAAPRTLALPRSPRAMTFYEVAMFQGPSKPLPGPSRIPKHSECPIWTSETGFFVAKAAMVAVPGPMSLGLPGGPGQMSPRKKPSECQLRII